MYNIENVENLYNLIKKIENDFGKVAYTLTEYELYSKLIYVLSKKKYELQGEKHV